MFVVFFSFFISVISDFSSHCRYIKNVLVESLCIYNSVFFFLKGTNIIKSLCKLGFSLTCDVLESLPNILNQVNVCGRCCHYPTSQMRKLKTQTLSNLPKMTHGGPAAPRFEPAVSLTLKLCAILK